MIWNICDPSYFLDMCIHLSIICICHIDIINIVLRIKLWCSGDYIKYSRYNWKNEHGSFCIHILKRCPFAFDILTISTLRHFSWEKLNFKILILSYSYALYSVVQTHEEVENESWNLETTPFRHLNSFIVLLF